VRTPITRLAAVVTACVVGAGLIPGAATADRPEREELSPVGDQFLCGETLLTVTDGTIVARTQVHELKSGLFRVIQISLPKRVTAEDEEGVVYRVVGPVHGNFETPDPEEETGEEVGFFHQKLNFIGPGGLLGTLDIREQRKPNGDEVIRDRSTCEFVEPND
jgi:hypothetical protein